LKFELCMHVRLQLENGNSNLLRSWAAYAVTLGRNFGKVTFRKIVTDQVPARAVPVAPKQTRQKNGVKTKVFSFDGKITGTKATTPKTVMDSSPGKFGFFSSETKHDRRTAPRCCLFRWERRATPRKILDSSPGETNVYSSETNDDGRMAPGPKLFLARILHEKRSQTSNKSSRVRVLMKMVFLYIKNWLSFLLFQNKLTNDDKTTAIISELFFRGVCPLKLCNGKNFRWNIEPEVSHIIFTSLDASCILCVGKLILSAYFWWRLRKSLLEVDVTDWLSRTSYLLKRNCICDWPRQTIQHNFDSSLQTDCIRHGLNVQYQWTTRWRLSAPVGSIVPAQDQQDVITRKWVRQPKLLERIRNPKFTMKS
jgi:hypothetical protein